MLSAKDTIYKTYYTTPIVQKTYNVGITKPDVEQTSVYNKLEYSVENISQDMAILTGTLGEQWPVKLSKIFKNTIYPSNNMKHCQTAKALLFQQSQSNKMFQLILLLCSNRH